MSIFRFIFLSEPSVGAEKADDIAGGRIEVWAKESDAESAEAKARSYIMDCSWIVKELELLEPWPDELCPDPDKSPTAFAHYRKAENQGISVEIRAWPKVPQVGIYEYRPLGEPLIPDRKR